MTAGTSPAHPTPPSRRISVYIDGFNLYYGSLKGTPYGASTRRSADPAGATRPLLGARHLLSV